MPAQTPKTAKFYAATAELRAIQNDFEMTRATREQRAARIAQLQETIATEETKTATYQEVFAYVADEDCARVAADAIASGTASWILDPYVVNVVGLVLTGTNRAIALLYLDTEIGPDFDISTEFETMLDDAQDD